MKKSIPLLLRSESSLSGIFFSFKVVYILLKSDFPLKEVQLAMNSNVIVKIHICTGKYPAKQYMIHPVKMQKEIFDMEPDNMMRIYSLISNIFQFEQLVVFLLRQKVIS